MEKFSNSSSQYFEQIKAELGFHDVSEDEIFYFLEVSQLLRYGFSFRFRKDRSSKFELIFSVWKAHFDNSRFDKGIYNLSRLAVSKKLLELTNKEKLQLDSSVFQELEILNHDSIVLDGRFCELRIPSLDKVLNWNIDEQMNQELNKLVSWLRKKAST